MKRNCAHTFLIWFNKVFNQISVTSHLLVRYKLTNLGIFIASSVSSLFIVANFNKFEHKISKCSLKCINPIWRPFWDVGDQFTIYFFLENLVTRFCKKMFRFIRSFIKKKTITFWGKLLPTNQSKTCINIPWAKVENDLGDNVKPKYKYKLIWKNRSRIKRPITL